MKQLAKLVCNCPPAATHMNEFFVPVFQEIYGGIRAPCPFIDPVLLIVYTAYVERLYIVTVHEGMYLNLYEVSLLVQQLNTLVNMQDAAIFLYM